MFKILCSADILLFKTLVNGFVLLKWHMSEWKSLSHVQLFGTPWNSPWDSPGQNAGVGSCSLFQVIFPTQGSKPGLPHCRRILYHLSHNGSPRTLEWVASPFSSGSSWPRNQTRVSCITGRFFTNWAIREALEVLGVGKKKRWCFRKVLWMDGGDGCMTVWMCFVLEMEKMVNCMFCLFTTIKTRKRMIQEKY